ncbi:MAG: ROK family protein [bacterium]|nr:ROK family protein [bacterium]
MADGSDAIGLELGGTWSRAAVLGDGGAVGARCREPTPREPEALGGLLVDLWRRLGASRTVALAAAPQLDGEGNVRRWPGRPETVGAPVLGPLRDAGAFPEVIDDASAAAVAEHLAATEREVLPSSTVFLGIGTGLGGGAVLDDELWLGARGGAMDMGHVRVPSAGERPCTCGRVGCLQTVVSGPALAEQAARQGISPDALGELADDGAIAGALFRPMVTALVEGIQVVDALLEPDRLVLGGGVIENWGRFFEWVVEAAQDAGITVPVLGSRWQTWAGALGAAAFVIRRRGQWISRIHEGNRPDRMRIALIQGPNLNLLGEREPEHYGHETLEDLLRRVEPLAEELGVALFAVQSNHEGELVDWVQRRRHRLDAAVVNPAALTAHGYSLRDALTGIPLPFVEVHLSNIDGREAWHRESCFAGVAVGRISGLRGVSYEMALRGLVQYLQERSLSIEPSAS